MTKKNKILFLDIETSMVTANIWRPGNNISVPASSLVRGSHTDIICIGYKWAGSKTVKCPDWGVQKQDSKKMLQEVIKAIEKADVVIGHNGDAFDIKLINTLAIKHRLPPISWPVTEDTLKMARKHFRFTSNKLDFIARYLLSDKKITTDISLWNKVQFDKCPKAMRKMKAYCKKDVILLEEVFNVLQPYCTPKVNRALLAGNDRYDCPSCGSSQTQKHGKYTSRAGIYQKHKCMSCSHVYKGKKIPQK